MGERRFFADVCEDKLIRPRLNVSYPKIKGLKNQTAQDKINETIKKKVWKMVLKQGYQSETALEIWGGYKVKANKKGILSVLLEQYSYVSETTCGRTRFKALNFDLNDGKQIKLNDLFRTEIDCISKLGLLLQQQVIEKQVPLIRPFIGIDSKQEFYLTEDSLVAYFQINEYTPYEYGVWEAEIPYIQIKDLVHKKGAIGRLVRF